MASQNISLKTDYKLGNSKTDEDKIHTSFFILVNLVTFDIDS